MSVGALFISFPGTSAGQDRSRVTGTYSEPLHMCFLLTSREVVSVYAKYSSFTLYSGVKMSRLRPKQQIWTLGVLSGRFLLKGTLLSSFMTEKEKQEPDAGEGKRARQCILAPAPIGAPLRSPDFFPSSRHTAAGFWLSQGTVWQTVAWKAQKNADLTLSPVHLSAICKRKEIIERLGSRTGK